MKDKRESLLERIQSAGGRSLELDHDERAILAAALLKAIDPPPDTGKVYAAKVLREMAEELSAAGKRVECENNDANRFKNGMACGLFAGISPLRARADEIDPPPDTGGT